MQIYISLVASVVSLVSLVVAFAGYRRTKKTQEYDYGIRLQIENEKREFGSPSLLHFRYSASIRNKGLKPVKIGWLWMQYGETTPSGTSRRLRLDSGFTLSPGEERSVSFVKDKAEIIEMLQEAGDSECVFSLVAEFQSFEGKLQTTTRQLGGYTRIDGEIGLLFAAQHEMLT